MKESKLKHLMSDETRFIAYLIKLNTENLNGGIIYWDYVDDYLPLLKTYGYKNDEEAIEDLRKERSYAGKIRLLKKRNLHYKIND